MIEHHVIQMELIAKLQHPYIVEYKDSWVEKVTWRNYFTESVKARFQPVNIQQYMSCCFTCSLLQGCYVCIVTGFCEGGDL